MKTAPPEHHTHFKHPKTKGLYEDLRRRFPRSGMGGPIVIALWTLCNSLEGSLVLAKDAERIYPLAYLRLREIALAHGYAVAIHGTQRRDLDVVAIPWTDKACSAEALVEAILADMGGLVVHVPSETTKYDTTKKNPVYRAHGRRAWLIHLGGGPMVDLSIMPRREESWCARWDRKVRELVDRLKGDRIEGRKAATFKGESDGQATE